VKVAEPRQRLFCSCPGAFPDLATGFFPNVIRTYS
jgi:hypothetical protein